MRSEKLRHEATAEVVRGGSSWARWWQETLEAMCTWEEADDGLTEAREEEYKPLTAPWTDPSFWFLNALLHACWGQRPRHEPTSSAGSSHARRPLAADVVLLRDLDQIVQSRRVDALPMKH